MNHNLSKPQYPQHALGTSFLLHVLPGLLTAMVFVLLKPLIDATGYPPLLAFLLAVLLIDIPFMLGVIFSEGKKTNGKFSLKGIILYREHVSWKTFLGVFVIAFVVLYLLIVLSTPVNTLIAEKLFSWAPHWLFLDDAALYAGYEKRALVLVFTLHLLITGILLPWIEELYFRGYLMPRISRYAQWTPLMGGVFFGLYHVWQLFSFVGVFLLGTGLGYIVWWKKDIRVSISLHVFANALVRVVLLMGILAIG